MTAARDPLRVLETAQAHARRRGRASICLMFPYRVGEEFILLARAAPGLGAVGHPDGDVSCRPGVWTPPAGANVYFAGSPADLTVLMMRAALRAHLRSLACLTALGWIDVPLGGVRRAKPAVQVAHRAALQMGMAVNAVRAPLARAIARLSPWARPVAARIAGPGGLDGGGLERTVASMLALKPTQPPPEPHRVVMICGNLSPGGAERQAALTALGLGPGPLPGPVPGLAPGPGRRRLESVTLLCHDLTPQADGRPDFHLPMAARGGATVREIRRLGVETWPEPLRPLAGALPAALAGDVLALYREFADLRPEVVHAWLDWDNVRAGLAAALAGVPRIVLSGRNLNPTHFQFHQPYMNPVYRALLRLPNVVLTNNSEAGAADYARWLGQPAHTIPVIRNACAFADGREIPTRSLARAALGHPTNTPLIGGMFRFEPEKRPILWLRTAAIIARRRPDARFVLFGQGRLEATMRRTAERLGLTGRLRFCGVWDQAEAALSALDVLLLTSKAEGLPNVLIEAQWVGTPVIATDVGGVRETMVEAVTGRAIQTSHPMDLAEAVIEWLERSALVEQARSQGPRVARERFSLERMLDDTLRVYRLAREPGLDAPRGSD